MSAKKLLARAQAALEAHVSCMIECMADQVMGPDRQIEPLITPEILAEFAPDILLLRDIRMCLGTKPNPDPDWFDRLVDGEPS